MTRAPIRQAKAVEVLAGVANPVVAVLAVIGTLWCLSSAAGQQSAALRLPFFAEFKGPGYPFTIVNTAPNALSGAVFGKGFYAIIGESALNGGFGVGGSAQGQDSAGVDGRNADGYGVYGRGTIGVMGVTTKGWGVAGEYRQKVEERRGVTQVSQPSLTRGYLGTSTNGVQGESDVALGIGVEGLSKAPNGKGVGGKADGGKYAVAIYGESKVGMAGFFRGRVTITDSLLVTDIYAKKFVGGAKLFKIDHPLDPEGKFLSHSTVESDQMKNVYDGVVILDASGSAWVTLPAWFQALNEEFRYQLTCVGGYAPVYIAEEINENRFRVAGGTANLKVSWQVTGVRRDAYAKAHPLQVEEKKLPSQRGKYLHPIELGRPASAVLDAERSKP